METVGDRQLRSTPARASDADPPPFAQSAAALTAALGSDASRGLAEEEARRRLARDGPNRLREEPPPPPAWKRFAHQFDDLLVWILLAALAISAAFGDWLDALAILAIVLLNAALGFLQDGKAERAIRALASLSAPRARVVRGGTPRETAAEEVVRGDVLLLEPGDLVAADARLLDSSSFRTQEAALTGESVPVDKSAAVVLAPSAPLADRANMAHAGTSVAAGRARALVTATGMRTELGRIAGLIATTGTEATPLQRHLHEFGRLLIRSCLGAVVVVAVARLVQGEALIAVFLLAVSLAVAAVPEGLPTVVTLVLSLGLQRMARRNALVRRLASVETLGSVSAICTDKTGTLTRNEMTVRAVHAGGARYAVRGAGYAPTGTFAVLAHEGERTIDARTEPDLLFALRAGACCNNARLSPGATPDSWGVVGDPTEGALLVAALKAGIEPPRDGPDGARVLAEIPFSSERRRMSVVVREPDGATRMYLKGSPETVLALCDRERSHGADVTLSPERRRAIAADAAELAGRALRVLALAHRDLPAGADGAHEEGLVFLGLAGMLDPPRPEAQAAVRACRAAGIRVAMVTGDHAATALAIARELGLEPVDAGALTGTALDELDDDQLAARVESVAVFARATAEHKLRIVRALERRGHVVAMTGDGVNDAPALKAAAVGVAMGVSGTEVTRQASDIVLTDDNFASLASAVAEGRVLFDDIEKAIRYLLVGNASEVLLMLGTALAGWPSPLAPIQILWINLVTDGLPALALGVEPAEPDVMERPPRPAGRPILGRRDAATVLLQGALLALASAAGFAWVHRGAPERESAARTAAFCIAAGTQLFFALACRSRTRTLPELGAGTNPQLLAAMLVSAVLQVALVTLPPLRPLFATAPLLPTEWALVATLSLAPATLVELTKIARARVLFARARSR